MPEPMRNQLKKMFAVLKQHYPNQHTEIIMECLEESNITLPVKDQSKVLPVAERPTATPRKRVVVEEAGASGSGKKQKVYRTNPYIDDEAGCSDEDDDDDYHHINDNHQANKNPQANMNVNAAVKKTNPTSKSFILPDLEKIQENLELLSKDNRLKRVDVPVSPQLVDDTNQDAVMKYIEDILRYHDVGEQYGNLGLLVQYAGGFRLFCLCETIKKDYPGFHTTVIDLLKKCNYKDSKINTMKAVGRKFNMLLHYFSQGAAAIVTLYSTNQMRRFSDKDIHDIIDYVKKNKDLTEKLRALKIHQSTLKNIGELTYVNFKPMKK